MKNTFLDFEAMTESVRKDGRRHDYKIDEIEVYDNYLFYRRKYVDHKCHESIEYHLFPNENIGIYKLYQYKDCSADPSEIYHYYVDMVSVSKDKNLWVTKDLYIDFIIKRDGRYYVVDIDEFKDAITSGDLDGIETTKALNGLDNVLKGYYEEHDLVCYIEKLRKRYTQKDELLFLKSQKDFDLICLK